MGLFSFRKKNVIEVGAPVSGEYVSLKEVTDPTFREEILGNGIAVLPAEGRIYAPCDGTVTTVFPTGHAVAVTSDEGAEILIHVGLDTVKLEGHGFSVRPEAGGRVKRGELLLEADISFIKNAGYESITPVIVCNTSEFSSVEAKTGRKRPGETCLELTK